MVLSRTVSDSGHRTLFLPAHSLPFFTLKEVSFKLQYTTMDTRWKLHRRGISQLVEECGQRMFSLTERFTLSHESLRLFYFWTQHFASYRWGIKNQCLFVLKPFILGQEDNDRSAFHKLQDVDSILICLVTLTKGRHTKELDIQALDTTDLGPLGRKMLLSEDGQSCRYRKMLVPTKSQCPSTSGWSVTQ